MFWKRLVYREFVGLGVGRQVECEVFRGARFEVEREAECRVV